MKNKSPLVLLWILLLCPHVLSDQGAQSEIQKRRDSPHAAASKASTDETTDEVDPLVKYWSNFVDARSAAIHFAWTVAGDHENAGIYTSGGGTYLGVEATHTLFKAGDFNLEVPPGAQGVQTLFAPTTRPPNGACLEMGTAYTTLVGRPTAIFVYAYDFCRSPKQFVRTMSVDDAFIQKYAREGSGGNLEYKIRIKPDGNSITRQTSWNAMIFDYTKNDWSTVAVSKGYVASDLTGWSIFETWYKKGQCSKTLKPIRAMDISYYNSSTNEWEPIRDDMRPLRNSLDLGGNCFVDEDRNNLASYQVSALEADHGWQVVGTGH